MAQRTGRRVGSDNAKLPAHGKKVSEANKMHPGVTQPMQMGDGTSTDCSGANDGSKAAPSAPKGSHKGPDRTK